MTTGITGITGFNNSGQVIGLHSYFVVTDSVVANYAYNFIYNGGSFTTIATPNAGSGANGINDAGQIVGVFSDGAGTHGFLNTDGVLTTIDDPGATPSPGTGYTVTEPYDINNAGQVVGIDLGPGYWNGFLETNGTFTAVTDPSAFVNAGSSSPGTIAGGGTFPTGINNLGQIVGYYFDAQGTSFGFLDTSGTFDPVIDPLAAGFGTSANGINDSGTIVGDYTPAGNTDQDGFVDIDGVFTTIAVPDAIQTQVRGIDNLGTIAGQWVDGSNDTHGFIGVPTAPGATSYTFTTIDAPDTGGELVSCFRTGTRLATTRGDVPVEFLRVGDRLRTLFNGSSAVCWIGHRRIDCQANPRPDSVWPVLVRSEAFGANRPYRDLWLSPDQAVLVNDVLVPIRYLINGITVVREPVDEVIYYHVELPEHDLVMAEGLCAESYLDAGDRANFSNGGNVTRLFPDLVTNARLGSQTSWETRGCLDLVLAGPKLERARQLIDAVAIARLSTATRTVSAA